MLERVRLLVRSSYLLPIIIGLFCLACLRFALLQEVWIDESTQLAGISVSPIKTLQWLAGEDVSRFGVPGDRMPPLSYLADWLWSKLFGSEPFGFRVFHASILISAIVALTLTVKRRFGGRTAIVFASFVALSPSLIMTAVEIRSYPIFVALTALCLTYFFRLLTEEWRGETRPLAIFASLCALAIYTHLFALAMTGAFFLALLYAHRSDFQRVRKIFVAGAVVGVASIGILPFVLASASLSAGHSVTSSFMDYVEYVIRLVASPQHLVEPILLGILLLGIGALLSVAIWRLVADRTDKDDQHMIAQGLVIVVCAGVSVTVFANMVQSTLFTIKSSYSVWLTPIIFLLAAIGYSTSTPIAVWNRYLRHGFLALAILGALSVNIIFLIYAQYFVHGPSGQIAKVVDRAEGRVGVIYVDATTSPYGAFPLQLRYNLALPQFSVIEELGRSRYEKFEHPKRTPPQQLNMAQLAEYDSLIFVKIKLQPSSEVGAAIKSGAFEIGPSSVVEEFNRSTDWRLTSTIQSPGNYAYGIWTFESVAE